MIRILLLLFLVPYISFTQTDTINIVAYNLLNFPDGRDDCSNNTVVPNRTDTLKKILDYLEPDIFVACEIQTEAGADSILTQSLNTNGVTNFAKAVYNANSGTSLQNSLYYNTNKLTLQSQSVIPTYPRLIDHYVLYINDPSLGTYFDTTFIEVYMCHLKAGSSSSNQATRADQTELLMQFIANRPSDRNHFICGDLNVYNSNEDGYQNIVNGILAFEDPINEPGNWNNNSAFADIHTQSTRTFNNFDCGSKGGCDDRFDQILVSSNVMTGSDNLNYINNSYRAIGNDGNHFNSNLLSGVNSIYPAGLVNALYYMSDHLPVELKTIITYPTSNGLALYPNSTAVTCNNGANGTATITANDGQPPYTYQWDASAGNQTTQTATNLSAGSYCVTVTDNLGEIDDYCIYVSEPSPISFTSFLTPETDNCNGIAHLLLGGGVPPYNVTWNDLANQTGTSAYNLCAGSYLATVSDDAGCITQIEITIEDNTSSILELISENITIFPNPANNQVEIKLNDYKAKSIKIRDLSGRIVLSSNSEQDVQTFNLTNFENGTYFVELMVGLYQIKKKLVILKN
ncbi:MAG: T9SS type A sorting domain-containing protein [Crocinitomicaceae bacterium]|nr:T9SS type A sorting domain-containing protein [Crocinitomicaceae bacterium]